MKLDNGMIKAPARLTRTGVFEYRMFDGSIVRELRAPEEVFAQDSVDSFALVPLTNNHPTENGGLVTADNAKRLAIGSVGEPRVDGRFLSATILVTDSEGVAALESGKQELSCGYYCDREPAAPGSVFKDPDTGALIPYDFIQRNIRGNHVALVNKGRAGPDVRVQLDSADAIMIDSECGQTYDNVGEPKEIMQKLTFDGVELEVSPDAAKAIEAERAAAKAELEKTLARADAAEGQVTKLTQELVAATSQERINVAVKARVAIETEVRAHLGNSVELDSLDETGLKKAVIAKLDSELLVEGKSPEYIDAVYATLTKITAKRNALTEAAAKAVAGEKAPVAELSPRAKFEAQFFGKQ